MRQVDERSGRERLLGRPGLRERPDREGLLLREEACTAHEEENDDEFAHGENLQANSTPPVSRHARGYRMTFLSLI
jgi:hypothetical protein